MQIKSRRMKWVGHVACMGEETRVYKVLVGKPEGGRPLGRPRQGGRIELEWILGRLGGGVWSAFTWLRIGTGGRLS
jgi:hypothetical protein